MNRNTAAYRSAVRASMIPKGPTVTKVALKDGSATVYLYSTGTALLAMGFRGNAGRPEFHYSYRNEQTRRQAVEQFLSSVQKSQAFKAERKAKKAAWVNPLKVGEILYTSWGYDQTNVEFFVVTRIAGRRVWVREIAADYEQTGYMSGNTWPAMPIAFKGPETMHVAQPSGSSVYVKIDTCRNAHPETGRMHNTTSYA